VHTRRQGLSPRALPEASLISMGPIEIRSLCLSCGQIRHVTAWEAMLLASQFADCHVSNVPGLVLRRYRTNTPAKAALSSTAAAPAKSDG
jgi:hypothetical protein